MSVDALTITAVRNREDVWGRTRTNLFDITLSSAYPVGGYTLTPHRVGLSTLQAVVWAGGNAASVTQIPFLNTATGKLMIINNTSGLEHSDNDNLAAYTVRVRVEGE